MTRERAKELAPIIAAFGNGVDIEYRPFGGQWDSVDRGNWLDACEYRIKPASKRRPMTRGEVLYMVTTTPAMVVRLDGGDAYSAGYFSFSDAINNYEYAIIDKHGEPVDGWHKFEIEADE
jgi:hypothetical protein